MEVPFSNRNRLEVALLGGDEEDRDGRIKALRHAMKQLGLSEPLIDVRSERNTSISFVVNSATGEISRLENLIPET